MWSSLLAKVAAYCAAMANSSSSWALICRIRCEFPTMFLLFLSISWLNLLKPSLIAADKLSSFLSSCLVMLLMLPSCADIFSRSLICVAAATWWQLSAFKFSSSKAKSPALTATSATNSAAAPAAPYTGIAAIIPPAHLAPAAAYSSRNLSPACLLRRAVSSLKQFCTVQNSTEPTQGVVVVVVYLLGLPSLPA